MSKAHKAEHSNKRRIGNLFVFLIAYSSLLILCMPATTIGIVQTLLLVVVGAVIVVWKKPRLHKRLFLWKYLLLAGGILGYLGNKFYNRWLPASKIQTISSVLCLRVEELLIVVCIVLSACAVIFLSYHIENILNFLGNIIERLSYKKRIYKKILIGFMMSITTVMLAQSMIGVRLLSMGIFKFCMGVLLVYIIIMLLYCFLGSIKWSIAFVSVIFMIISTINVYTYCFRGRLFEPVDILAVRTVMNVAGNYSLWPMPVSVISGWAIWAGVLISLFGIAGNKKEKVFTRKKTRLQLAGICFIGLIIMAIYTINLTPYHWNKQGATSNGYVLDFVAKFKEAYVSKPNGYSKGMVDSITEKYNENTNCEKLPHIIVIMNEAFSDLSVLGDFQTNTEVTPFISELKENVTRGYALASIYGGNTANSEFEFLTGNTMAWLSPNTIPYQQYMRSSTYSMISYLKKHYDYTCIAMHPYLSNGWNRPSAYVNLGFDDSLFLEDFPQENIIRNFVSDQEMFDKIIDVYENQKEERLFLFGVSMQNHGDYNYTGDNFEQSISLQGCVNEYSAVEQYLSLIHETDKAVEYLLSYFSNVDEDVVIVFFGDHQPQIDESFYETIGAGDDGSLDTMQNRYKIPFFIWTNYDLEERQI